MDWTTERLEAADGKYLYFPTTKTARLLRKSGRGWKIGVAREAVSTQVALQFLNYHQVTLATEDERIHI